MQASECIKKNIYARAFTHLQLLKILNLIHFKENKFSYRCLSEKLLEESMKPTFSFIFWIKKLLLLLDQKKNKVN